MFSDHTPQRAPATAVLGTESGSVGNVNEAELSEERQILNAYRRLVRACQNWTNKADRKAIRKAFEFALWAHEGQRRKTGEPYILHPIAVARSVVKEIGLRDAVAVQAALLHDTVEDTKAEHSDIRQQFGDEVAVIVEGLTKIAGVFDLTTTTKQAENLRKMLLTLSDDIRVALVKIADRLHNMRTLGGKSQTGQLRIAAETELLYAPLAGRFGLYNVKAELEDLALRYTEPTVFASISAKLAQTKAERDKYIANFLRPIRDKLQRYGIRATIKHRIKSVSSIYQKMQRQGIPFNEVYDLFAIRIVIYGDHTTDHPGNPQCWRVYNLVTGTYRPHPGRLRDWLSMPKSSGYRALHTTVMGPQGRWVEVQIRTKAMDDFAEKGGASHWKYKDGHHGETSSDEALEQWLSKIQELLESPDLNAKDFVQEVKSSLVTEEIFVFTPRGDLKVLPQGATALDFAYAIHTRLGDTCIGAKVNQRVVSLNHVLANGDQVEVITSGKQQPNEEWLGFARTSRARNKIKAALKEQRKAVAAKGKAIFDRKIKQLEIPPNHRAVKELLASFNLPSLFDLYYQLGAHKIDLQRLTEFIERKQQSRELYERFDTDESFAQHKHDEFEAFLRRTLGRGSDKLVVDDHLDADRVTLAACCNPIPGDDVIAFVDPEEGVTIHRTNCVEAMALMSSYGHKLVKANWSENSAVEFLASIRIVGHDTPGMLNKIIRVLSLRRKHNLRQITISAHGGTFSGDFKLFVADTADLRKTIEMLETIRGVHSVTRITH